MSSLSDMEIFERLCDGKISNRKLGSFPQTAISSEKKHAVKIGETVRNG